MPPYWPAQDFQSSVQELPFWRQTFPVGVAVVMGGSLSVLWEDSLAVDRLEQELWMVWWVSDVKVRGLIRMGTGCSAWARVARHGHGLLDMGTGCSAWAQVAQHGNGLLSMAQHGNRCGDLVLNSVDTYSFALDYAESQCEEFSVRLTFRERTEAAGNLEICYGNKWNIMCADLLDQNVLNVACRALGFTAFEQSIAEHQFLPTTAFVQETAFEQKLNCSGTERSLSECDIEAAPARNITNTSCLDVRIQCLGRYVRR